MSREPSGQAERIRAVIADAEGEYEDALAAWRQHLQTHLSFPFDAEIVTMLGNGPLQVGEKVSVIGIEEAGDWYGVIVLMRHQYGLSPFPLAHLQLLDLESPAYQMLEDYRTWFARQKP
jgi:hypothetical protein